MAAYSVGKKPTVDITFYTVPDGGSDRTMLIRDQAAFNTIVLAAKVRELIPEADKARLKLVTATPTPVNVSLTITAYKDDKLPEMVTIADGPTATVLEQLDGQQIKPETALAMVRSLLSDLFAQTSMKGCMVMGMFDGVGVGGFGALSPHMELTAQEIRTWLGASLSQVDLMREQFKQMGLDAGDGKLILPGDPRYVGGTK